MQGPYINLQRCPSYGCANAMFPYRPSRNIWPLTLPSTPCGNAINRKGWTGLLSYVRTVDSDVAVLAIHFFPRLSLSELRVCLGSGKKVCDTPSMHDIRTHLGSSRSLALPLFHALTGCDTTSQFLECGKKTAETLSWQNTPGLTETLVALTVNGLVPAAA